MNKLPKLTGKELGKIIERFGFTYSHTTGSHMVYKHLDGRKTTIPHHSGEEIGPGLLNKIIKRDLQITREKFISKVDE
ncbi:MAG: type II toxin-antitoxin system HicA family toxin [Candidatus Woesearchaeota archaeon]